MFEQRAVVNIPEGLDFKPVRQGQLIQLGGNGLGAKRGDLTRHNQIDIGTLRVRAFCPRSKERGRYDLGVSPKDGPHHFELTGA